MTGSRDARAQRGRTSSKIPPLLLVASCLLISSCGAPVAQDFAANPSQPATSDLPDSPSPRKMTSVPVETTAPKLEPPTFQIENEIRAAYTRRYAAYWECLRTPVDCDDSYLWPGGPAALHMAAVRAELVARDRHVGSEPIGYHKVEHIQIAADHRSAEVTACWWSTAVLYGAPIYSDRPPSVSNPLSLVTSTSEGGRQRDRFIIAEGAWLLVSSAALDQGFVEDPCSS